MNRSLLKIKKKQRSAKMMQKFQKRVPRNFTIRQDLLAQMDKQIPSGSRSRWVEKLMMDDGLKNS